MIEQAGAGGKFHITISPPHKAYYNEPCIHLNRVYAFLSFSCFMFKRTLLVTLLSIALAACGAAQPTATACIPADPALVAMLRELLVDWRDPCAEFDWLPDSEFLVRVKLNNFGLHGPTYTLEKAADTFRIVVIGDSFPQGWQVEQEQGFPRLLEKQLAEQTGRKIEVINLSVDAFGTDRELLLYAALGWQFQPDLLLLAVYTGNDLQDNQIDLEARRYGYRLGRPYFTLENGVLQLRNSTPLDPARYPDAPAYQWLADMQAAGLPSGAEDPPERPRILSSDPYTLEYPVGVGLYLPEDRHWANAWALTGVLLLQFRAVAALDEVPLAVAIIPDKHAVHRADWNALVTQYAALLPDLRQADSAAPGQRLADFLTGEGIPALDLTERLRNDAAANLAERLYYGGDGHFTPRGHAVTANALAEWLSESGLLQ